MSDDDAFVAAVVESPDDIVLRLVYADWLDERDDPRGRFLRLDVEIRQRGQADPDCAALHQQLAELAAVVDVRWRLIMRPNRSPVVLWSPYDLGDPAEDESSAWLDEQIRQQLVAEDEPRQRAGRRWVWAYIGLLLCSAFFLAYVFSVFVAHPSLMR